MSSAGTAQLRRCPESCGTLWHTGQGPATILRAMGMLNTQLYMANTKHPQQAKGQSPGESQHCLEKPLRPESRHSLPLPTPTIHHHSHPQPGKGSAHKGNLAQSDEFMLPKISFQSLDPKAKVEMKCLRKYYLHVVFAESSRTLF